jgi:hypothetical protein
MIVTTTHAEPERSARTTDSFHDRQEGTIIARVESGAGVRFGEVFANLPQTPESALHVPRNHAHAERFFYIRGRRSSHRSMRSSRGGG